MMRAETSWQEECEDRLRFETLLADLSAQFINVPSDRLDSEIEGAQCRLCQCLNLDRSTLWLMFEENPGALLLTHVFHPPGGPPVPRRPDGEVMFPWVTRMVLAGQTVAISNLDELPPDAAHDREMFHRYGTKSTVIVPLSVGSGAVLGALTFASMREQRTWPPMLLTRFRLVAQIFANALARRRTDQALRDSEERLHLAADSAGAGLWSLDLATGCFWVTPKTLELFGFSPNEFVTLDRFLSLVHPEDRDRIRKKIQTVVQSKQEERVEYRIVRSNGNTGWFASRGRVHCNASGDPVCLMGVSIDITERKRTEEVLKAAYEEIRVLKEKLEAENVCLREEIESIGGHGAMVGQNEGLRRVIEQARQVAQTDSTVLILGETGTGKELLAHFIHAASARRDRPLITANLAAMPPALIENELFGREKGAYTGAMARQMGRFETAHEGTIFLDEVGEMPPETQVKILRVLQDGRFERLGSSTTIRVNVRVIAATNRNLAEAVKKGTFREDLYYRLNVFPLTMPPLRERREDIPLLVWAFVKEFGEKMGKLINRIHRQDLEALTVYAWPGNIRELRNVVERAMILSTGTELRVKVPESTHSNPAPGITMNDMEKRHILRILETTGGRIAGRGGAADLLGLKPPTLYFRLKKLGIERNLSSSCSSSFPTPGK